ncbi:unnamed protein product [Brassica oleracea var. botrytis]
MAEEEKPATTPEPTLPSPPEFPSNPDDPPPETPTPPAKFDPSRTVSVHESSRRSEKRDAEVFFQTS